MSLQAQDCWDASEKILDAADVPHVFRYYLARGFIEPGDRVLDAACGYGYGTRILARSLAKSVLGVDKGEFQLEIANKRNTMDNVSYQIKNLDEDFYLDPVDYIVSIETLEHLDSPLDALRVFKKVAKRMLLSVPIGKTTHTNQWHKHDYLIRDDFIKLVVDDKWKLFHSATHGGGVHELFYFVRR
jgi:2-polyprenyl-3-methyl-5-hydroxy-6-metoxy-1,4-benzoquinol methylase